MTYKGVVTMNIKQEIGEFCADGRIGLTFLQTKINPALSNNQDITLDFEGVRNMNSSFANAVFGNLVKEHGKGILSRLSMVNLRDNVKAEIIAGLSYGKSSLN